MSFARIASFSLASLAAACAVAHNHITVDTASGSPGDSIIIRAGYYPDESGFSIADGRLKLNDDIAVYNVTSRLQGGQLDGWFAGDDILLTSDFYFAGGHLDGGNFMWELHSVRAVSGGPGRLMWGDFGQNGFEPLCDNSALARTERSFDTMIAGHDHEQGYAFDTPGVYDVTFIAWDSNGVYADSQPLTVRFNVHCPADFNFDGVIDLFDYLDFVSAFATGDSSADINEDGVVDLFDYLDFVSAFSGGC